MALGKVVVVSANQSLCFIIETLFRSRFKILCAKDALSGHLLLQSQHPGVLIIDLDFGTDDNIEFVQHVQSSWLYSVPVIILSSDPNLLNRFPEKNDLYHFPKPFNPLNLMSLAEQLLVKKNTGNSKSLIPNL